MDIKVSPVFEVIWGANPEIWSKISQFVDFLTRLLFCVEIGSTPLFPEANILVKLPSCASN